MVDKYIEPQQFFIFYHPETKKFKVSDNYEGAGLFIQITSPIVILHDTIVSFQLDHMYIQVQIYKKRIVTHFHFIQI